MRFIDVWGSGFSSGREVGRAKRWQKSERFSLAMFFSPCLGPRNVTPKGRSKSLSNNPNFSWKFPISTQFLLSGQDELPAIEVVWRSVFGNKTFGYFIFKVWLFKTSISSSRMLSAEESRKENLWKWSFYSQHDSSSVSTENKWNYFKVTIGIIA